MIAVYFGSDFSAEYIGVAVGFKCDPSCSTKLKNHKELR
jgi:hypothetical protein